MAGLYPDVPDHRMALDQDGSAAFNLNGTLSTTTQLTAGQITAFNDETAGNVQYSASDGFQYICVIFPELRDITNVYVAVNTGNQAGGATSCSVEKSTDTTNGINGTWAQIKASYGPPVNIDTTWRTAIQPVSSSLATRAIRIKVSVSFAHLFLDTFHIYGTISSGQNPDRLALWDPASDVQVGAAYFDWGNALRGTTADRTFRIKNLSATLSANTITCSVDALSDTIPTVVGQHTLSADAVTFAATASAGTLAPGTISGVMTLRRTTSSTAVLSLWAIRVHAAAASWS